MVMFVTFYSLSSLGPIKVSSVFLKKIFVWVDTQNVNI
jgi:hypothetical protein